MKSLLTLFCLIMMSVQSLQGSHTGGRPMPIREEERVQAPGPLGSIPITEEEIIQVPGPLGSIPYVEGDPCPDIPFCCPGPGNYPSAPSHGTGCALTVAAMAVPIILIAGVAAIILITSQPKNP